VDCHPVTGRPDAGPFVDRLERDRQQAPDRGRTGDPHLVEGIGMDVDHLEVPVAGLTAQTRESPT
jgi:hypothetical protein